LLHGGSCSRDSHRPASLKVREPVKVQGRRRDAGFLWS
jgi:hypothetical protein